MIENVKSIFVLCNGQTVGILKQVEDKIAFQYDEKWIKSGFSVSPISLPLSRQVFVDAKLNFGGIYGVFHDSLPDGWGELLVSRMLARQGISYERLSPLTKLSIVGENGLGGLSYKPTQSQNFDGNFNLDELAAQAAALLDNSDYSGNLDKLFAAGGSSGGVRPKAHICYEGAEWIVKFPCRIDPVDVGKKEFVANSLAKKCGINVSEFKLFPSEKCSGYFGSKRFDREGGKRVHVVSFSSLLETSHRIANLDYMHFFQVISVLDCGIDDMYEAFRRMCFNVLYGNRDDHGKNFSFLFDEHERRYRLTPAYDLMRTPEKSEHEMTILGNGVPNEKDLKNIAAEVNMSSKKCQQILEKVKETILSAD